MLRIIDFSNDSGAIERFPADHENFVRQASSDAPSRNR
jgi:hypothetical protein